MADNSRLCEYRHYTLETQKRWPAEVPQHCHMKLTAPEGGSSLRALSVVRVFPAAQVVKLVDTLASGASARKGVEVQVLSWAPLQQHPRHISLGCKKLFVISTDVV